MTELSKRQQQVLDLLLEGRSNKQIALELGVSENTIEFHLRNIYAKLQVHSRTEAMAKLGNSVGAPQVELRRSVVEPATFQQDNGGISFQELNMKNRLSYYVVSGLLFGAAYWFYFSASAKFFNGISGPVSNENFWGMWLIANLMLIASFGVWLFPATIPAMVEYRHSQRVGLSALSVVIVWVSAVCGYFISYVVMLALFGLPQMEYLLIFNEHTPDFWRNWRAIFYTLILSDLVKWVVISLFVGGISGLLSGTLYAYWFKKTQLATLSAS